MQSLQDFFNKLATIKVGVIGDVMLDTYMWGVVERISPEAPVPIVSLQKKEFRIGGAGNVALNICSLDASAWLISVIGDDEDGNLLLNLLQSNHINADYVLRSGDRITTNKIRVIGRNQQMMRLDAEVTNDLQPNEEQQLINKVKTFIGTVHPHVIILEDYNKGVLTEQVIRAVVQLCAENGVLTAVDPKRKNFMSYEGVDIFKPNLKEVKDALNLLHVNATVDELNGVHQRLSEFLKHRISFITLSEKGVYYNANAAGSIIPSHIRNIADVSGAGDTVMAVAALVFAASKDVQLMAEIANIAGGLVCEEVGTVAINKSSLMNECRTLLQHFN